MLCQYACGKINARRVTLLRLFSARLLSTLLKNPLLESMLLPRLQQNTQQRICYHNSEAEATGKLRQDYLRKQNTKVEYVELKVAHNGKANERFIIPRITTNTRHLGTQQQQRTPLTGLRSSLQQAQWPSKDCGVVDNTIRSTTQEKKEIEVEKPKRVSKKSPKNCNLPSGICVNAGANV